MFGTRYEVQAQDKPTIGKFMKIDESLKLAAGFTKEELTRIGKQVKSNAKYYPDDDTKTVTGVKRRSTAQVIKEIRKFVELIEKSGNINATLVPVPHTRQEFMGNQKFDTSPKKPDDEEGKNTVPNTNWMHNSKDDTPEDKFGLDVTTPIEQLEGLQDYENEYDDYTARVKENIDAARSTKEATGILRENYRQTVHDLKKAEEAIRLLKKEVTDAGNMNQKEFESMQTKFQEIIDTYGDMVHRLIFLIKYNTKMVIENRFTEEEMNLLKKNSGREVTTYSKLLRKLFSTPQVDQDANMKTIARLAGIQELLSDAGPEKVVLYNDLEKPLATLLDIQWNGEDPNHKALTAAVSVLKPTIDA